MNDYYIEFFGKAAHAASDPWNGRSATDGADLFIAGINAVDKETYGKRITQQNIGFEFKKFPHKIMPKEFYYRVGAGYSRLETTSGEVDNYYGNYSYLGFGREVPINNFGLALELAYRYTDYNKGLYVKTITPSIGFHFYKDL